MSKRAVGRASEAWKRAGKPWTALGGLVLVAWLIGAALFLAADGSVSLTLPRRAKPPEAEHNLALLRWGPTLRASSYYMDSFSQHHPIFLVDARADPHRIEKWASGYHDPTPWVEILWREPRALSRVVIRHAGWRERSALTVRRYSLSCLVDGTDGPSLSISDNTESVVSHPLSCTGARGLRVEWRPNERGDQVRVYEIEAWGR